MNEPTWLSVIPPVIAILLAIVTRRVILSLLLGIFSGWLLLSGFNPVTGSLSTVKALFDVFGNTGNAKVILFCGLVGAIIVLVRESGGMHGFVKMIHHRGYLKTRRSAQAMAGVSGCFIFIETAISSLVVGAVFRPVFDKLNISREKLAYICDSTSAPINLLVPLNAWGAYILGLLEQNNVSNPAGVLIHALPFQFYSLFAITIVFWTIWRGRDIGPMQKAERLSQKDGRRTIPEDTIHTGSRQKNSSPINMIVPIALMIGMMPVGMLISGGGNITKGSGSSAVLWAVSISLLSCAFMYVPRKIFSIQQFFSLLIKGVKEMAPLMILMLLAFAIGDVTGKMGTGPYVAKIAGMTLSPVFIPAMLFVLSCFISFSTGTSWGTFAIMIPIAIGISSGSEISLPLTTAAITGGGVFGDHCSPISDTTLIAAMASGSTLIDHVRTQLPYALLAAFLTTCLFILMGWVL